MNPLIQLKKAAPVFVVALVCFGFLPTMQAVSPPPDGGYGNFNTAEGTDALFSLTTGGFNTALGGQALHSDTNGPFNTAVGVNALFNNNSSFNTAVGVNALLADTTGGFNTATGVNALFNNNGAFNTANGVNALLSNTSGSNNTAIGEAALFNNTTASLNTAVGFEAMSSNTTNSFSVAVGYQALHSVTAAGTGSTAIGFQALLSATNSDNTALGDTAGSGVTTGSDNIIIGGFGSGAGSNITTGSNMISIGANPGNDPARCYIGRIYGNLQPTVGMDPDYVTVNSSGRLGRAGLSSRRYKHDIKPMDKASEQLYGLKPVTFRYLKEYDATQTIAFGLIAEDVAQVCPDLVGRDEKGQPASVRYEQINAMMLNEFLKEHKKVEEQQANIAELKSTIAQQQRGMEVLTAQLKEQAAQIQKVSAQLEVNKPAPQVVVNKP